MGKKDKIVSRETITMFLMKRFTSQTQKIGHIGEKIAVLFLMKRGFSVIETNYTQKIGEIDIVAIKDKTIHFIEVKSVSCGTFDHISRETIAIMPEDQFHVKKFRRFARTIQLYLAQRHVVLHRLGLFEKDWQVDLLTVYINHDQRQGRVVPFWNVVFE